jgi:CheY-like chemotaxis protein
MTAEQNTPQDVLPKKPLHDLNNHLAAIKGYTEILRQNKALSQESIHFLSRIAQAARDAIRLVQELQDHQRSSSPPPPSAPPSDPSESSAAFEPSQDGVEQLLIIEDDRAFREMLVSYLTRRGYRILDAHDGEEGIALLQKHLDDIDAVLLDRHMPKQDGLTVLRHLREIAPRLRVILISGADLSEDQEEIKALHIQATLKKPFPLKHLAHALREAFDTNPAKD